MPISEGHNPKPDDVELTWDKPINPDLYASGKATEREKRAEAKRKKTKQNIALGLAGLALAGAIGKGTTEAIDKSTTLPDPRKTPERASTVQPTISEADRARQDAIDKAREAEIRESLKPDNNELQ